MSPVMDEKFINWVKIKLTLMYSKESLESFKDSLSPNFYAQQQATRCNYPRACRSQNLTHEKKGCSMKYCNGLCQDWLDLIVFNRRFTNFMDLGVSHTDPRRPADCWEMVKVFQPYGSQDQHSASDADIATLQDPMNNLDHIFPLYNNRHHLLNEFKESRNACMHEEAEIRRDNKLMISLFGQSHLINRPFFVKVTTKKSQSDSQIRESQRQDFLQYLDNKNHQHQEPDFRDLGWESLRQHIIQSTEQFSLLILCSCIRFSMLDLILNLQGYLHLCSSVSSLFDMCNATALVLSQTMKKLEIERDDIRVVNESIEIDVHMKTIVADCIEEESAFIAIEHKPCADSLKSSYRESEKKEHSEIFSCKTLLEENDTCIGWSEHDYVSFNAKKEFQIQTEFEKSSNQESANTTKETVSAATESESIPGENEIKTSKSANSPSKIESVSTTATTATTESEITRGIANMMKESVNTVAQPERSEQDVARESDSTRLTRKYATTDNRTDVEHPLLEALEQLPTLEKEAKDPDRVLQPRSAAGESQSNDFVEVLRDLTHLPVGQRCVATVNVLSKESNFSSGGTETNATTDASLEEGSRAGTTSPEISPREGSTTEGATSGNIEIDGNQGTRSLEQATKIPCSEPVVEHEHMAKASNDNVIVPKAQSPTHKRITSEVHENNSASSEATANSEHTSLQCTDNCDTPEVLATNMITADSSVNTRHSITSEVSVDRDPTHEATSIVTDTSSETQPANTELDQVLQRMARGEEIGPRVTMRFELLRLCTMRNYPKTNKPYIIRLAAAGFYYAADGDEVICYCCGIRRRNWSAEEIPMDVHRRTSPKCSFILNNEQVNVRVPREENKSERPDRFANLRELLEPVTEGSGRQTGRDGDMSVPTLTQDTQQNSGSNSSTGTARQARPNYNLNRTPKHPHYGAYNVRLNSFIGWPSSSPQTPATLAEAGFYYAGMGDCVRCYHCSVGLRHWAAEDDPWIEHGRWTLENPCWYLVQKRGEEFLELIRMALQITDNQPPSANTSTPSEAAPTDTQHLEGTPAPMDRSRHVGAGRQSGKPVDSTSVVARGGNSSNTQMRKSNSCGSQSGNISSQPKSSSGETSQKGGSSAKLKQLKTENQQLRRQTLCHVCEERDVCIVFLPCGHLVTCSECAPQLRVCPVCNKVVKGTVRTYMS